MRKRSGRDKNMERKEDWRHVRYELEKFGKDKSQRKSIKLCPVSGPGALIFIGEALGLEVNKHLSRYCSIIRVK
jgi:hypothetical protein